MNIWIMNHHASDSGRHPSISKHLHRMGANVTLFSSSFQHNSYKEIKSYSNKQYYIFEKNHPYKRVFIKTPKYYNNGFRRLWNQIIFCYRSYKAGKKVSKQNDKPEVIIGSSVHLLTGLSAYFLSKRLNAKFIFEIRDVWPQTLVDLGALKEKSIVTRLFTLIEKFLYKKSNKIISVLPHGNNHITKYGIPEDKIVYIPNGIDLYNNENTNSSLPNEAEIFFQEHKDNFIATFTGAHGFANGLDTVVHTASELMKMEKGESKKSHILLVGDGPEKENLIEIARQYNLDNITFLNKVEKNQVSLILQQSDICLFHLKSTPVFKYGLSSNKLFDYMNSGKPMIFAADTSFDFAKEANNGISVPAESPDELAEAIIKMKQKTPNELERLGVNGKIFVEQYHDLKSLADDVYRTCELLLTSEKED